MDLFVIIIIIVFVLIIKYLIDTINSLNGEIKEIKEKCILNKGVTFNKKTEIPTVNTKDVIKGISYFKNYMD
jgi:predicted PurR-regulated permease PerM